MKHWRLAVGLKISRSESTFACGAQWVGFSRVHCVRSGTDSGRLSIEIISNIFNFYGPLHLNNILIYIQQDATLHSLFYLETAVHVSGGTLTYHQEHKQLYL